MWRINLKSSRFLILGASILMIILPSLPVDGQQFQPSRDPSRGPQQEQPPQQKNLICSEHFQCLSLQRTNDYLQHLKLNSSLPNWYELCNCDPYCHLFGDCCQDAPILDKLNLQEWSFVRIRYSSKINFLSLMKNKCPKDWNENEFVRIQCELSYFDEIFQYFLPEIEQYLLLDHDEEFKNWHVTGRHTLTTYRNIYCSICNNDTYTDAWNQRLQCQDDNNRCTAIYHQMAPDILGKEKLRRTPLQNKVYSGCNLGWYKMNFPRNPSQILDILKKCLIFYAPVVVRDPRSKKFIVFKNKYCAQCNNFEEDQFECAKASVDQPTQVPSSFNSIATFDSNFRDGSIIYSGTGNNDEKRCPRGTVFNPMNGECQEVFEDIVKGLQRYHHLNNQQNYSKNLKSSKFTITFFIVILSFFL